MLPSDTVVTRKIRTLEFSIWVQILAPSLSSCVILGKVPNFWWSVSSSENEDHNNLPQRTMVRSKRFDTVKGLKQCLAFNKHAVSTQLLLLHCYH